MDLFDEKNEIAPKDLGEILISEYIANDILCPRLQLDISVEQRNNYLTMCKIYRIALVLIVMMNEEHNNPKVLSVRESVEGRLFHRQNGKTLAFLDQVRGAMSDLGNLISSQGSKKELSWAISWLSSLGIDSSNPADLTLFAVNWMDQSVAIAKFLREIYH